MEGPQIGLYLCQCWGEIGRTVDLEGLAGAMGKKKESGYAGFMKPGAVKMAWPSSARTSGKAG